ISDDLKERALWLLDGDYLTEDVCHLLGVSRASVYRWRANQENYGTVRPPPNPLRGRPRILNPDQTHDLLTLLAESPELYLDEIMDWIAVTQDTGLSRTALHTLIHDSGLTYKILRRAASEHDDNHLSQAGRAPRGLRAEIEADFIRGERYSILAAITIDGYLGTRIVSGSVDGDEFFDFIVNDILPKMNAFPNDNSVLILDNCAIHKSAYLREMVEAQGISVYLVNSFGNLSGIRLNSTFPPALLSRLQPD
ncbi:hypothetical protein C8R44DRAFT_611773, partial [Mycena epipterygia]